MRMNRWSKNGILQRLFEGLQEENRICIHMEAICLVSTTVKVHPNGTGALKNLIMDRAYEGDETRNLSFDLGLIPVVPPKQNRKEPWEYDQKTYKRRNEIERFFLRIKRFRRVFTRYDKLDIIFAGFILFVMIIDSIV